MSNTVNLIQVAAFWGDLPHQRSAAQWLQQQTENKTLHDNLAWEFARFYRDNDNGATINFVDVFNFYAGLPHQTVALEYLQSSLQSNVLVEFTTRWRAAPPIPQSANLPVPFFHQRTPRTCFASSVSMMATYNSNIFRQRFPAANGQNAYQRYVTDLHSNFGDTTDPNSHMRSLQSLGLSPVYRTDVSLSQVIELLKSGTAVAMGILHRGSMQNPTGGGHWFCARGFTEDRNFIYVNDPWGSLNDGYTGDINNGNNARYSREQMNFRFTVETPGQDSRHGWALYLP